MLDANPTRESLLAFIRESDLEYATIGFIDLQGTVRGKYVSRAKLESALDGTTFPLVSLILDPTDAILFAPGLAPEDGTFGDYPARLLPETARLMPWDTTGRNLFILAEFVEDGAAYCPRNVYHRAFDYAAKAGYTPCHAVEFEFTLFNETAQSAADKGYRNMQRATPHATYYSLVRQGTQAEFYHDMMAACRDLRIPLESLHEEMGPGFMEATIRHGNGVWVADQAAMFRTFAKVVAQRRGQLMSFMARWSDEEDGQSGHIHMSLLDRAGKPVFHDPDAPDTISQENRWFIGGLQRLMGDFLLMFAPNINSFKRLIPGRFAPCSAVWGIENRTVALRAIPGSPKSARVENRVPGADANPYLSLAAMMAAGVYGIENRIEPTDPATGNAYLSDPPEHLTFPATFEAAIDRYQASEVAREIFGAAFVDGYADTRRSQLAQFAAMVTDRELERFFELV